MPYFFSNKALEGLHYFILIMIICYIDHDYFRYQNGTIKCDPLSKSDVA